MNDGSRRPMPLIASVIAALAFAVHVYANLGDYTAERGLVALGKTALMALAVGAMAWLVVETVLETFGAWLQAPNVDRENTENERREETRSTDKSS